MAMRYGGQLGTARVGRHLVLVDADGAVCAPVAGGPQGGSIWLTNSETKDAELTFAVPEGADPADFSLFVVDESGLARARFASGTPKPTTRPSTACPGVHVGTEGDPTTGADADLGERASLGSASVIVEEPTTGGSAPRRTDVPGPLAQTSLTIEDDPQGSVAAGASGLQVLDGDGNVCPVWSVDGGDPEFARAFTQQTGTREITFLTTGTQLPDGLGVELDTGSSRILVWK